MIKEKRSCSRIQNKTQYSTFSCFPFFSLSPKNHQPPPTNHYYCIQKEKEVCQTNNSSSSSSSTCDEGSKTTKTTFAKMFVARFNSSVLE